MMFKKAISLFTAGLMMAGMLAATGSMGVMAAERITEAKAKEIALEDAGVDESDLIYDRIEMGHEQGVSVYEIDFWTSTTEYDYDISVTDGEIVKKSLEQDRPAAGTSANKKAKATTKTGKTGRDAAIDAALSHAGFTAGEVYGLKCDKDYDDGHEIYEVEFKKGGYEYSYDIDANNYSVLEWDKDYDD